MTPYEEFQLTMYGNVLPESGSSNDNELDETERFEQWTEAMAEIELLDQN